MIADAKGNPHRYSVEPAVVRGAVFACEVPSSSGEEVYTIFLTFTGEWRCNCMDFVCRKKRDSGETCKHVDAVAQHYTGLEIFFFGLERWREVQRALHGQASELSEQPTF